MNEIGGRRQRQKKNARKRHKMTEYIIDTKRLKLRLLNKNDIYDLLLLFGDPIAMKYFPSVKDYKGTEEWLIENLTNYKTYGYCLLAVEKKDDNKFIGYCGFIPQKEVNGKDEIEIGYGLIRTYWHNGFANEAAIACKNYGFNKLKYNRLISLIRPENKASINVAIRNGMHWEIDLNRWDLLHGVYVIENSPISESH